MTDRLEEHDEIIEVFVEVFNDDRSSLQASSLAPSQRSDSRKQQKQCDH